MRPWRPAAEGPARSAPAASASARPAGKHYKIKQDNKIVQLMIVLMKWRIVKLDSQAAIEDRLLKHASKKLIANLQV
jgi:hypothetical protein